MRRPLTTALLRGVLDAGRAWRLIAGLWLTLLLVALPAGMTVFESLRGAIGARAVGEELRGAMDLVWLGEYQEVARGIAATVKAPVLARSALLVNLEDRWRGDLVGSPAALLGLGLLWAAVWIFASGVALDRFLFGSGPPRRAGWAGAGGPDPPGGAGWGGAGGWAGAGARHCGRLTRLALLSLPAYYGVHRLSAWLFPALEGRLRDVTQERIVLAWYLVAALGVALLLGLVELWFDYARVVAVGRDLKSGRRALMESARWLVANPLPAIGLQLALAAAGGVIVVVWLLLAPAPFESGWPGVAGVLLLGQLAVVARLVVRVGGLAAQSRLYRVLSHRSGG